MNIASCLHHLRRILWKLKLNVTTVALAMSSRMQMHEEVFTSSIYHRFTLFSYHMIPSRILSHHLVEAFVTPSSCDVVYLSHVCDIATFARLYIRSLKVSFTSECRRYRYSSEWPIYRCPFHELSSPCWLTNRYSPSRSV